MRTIRSNGLSETTCNIIIIIHQVSTLRTYPGFGGDAKAVLRTYPGFGGDAKAVLRTYPGFGGDAKAVLRNLYFAYLPDGTTRVSYNIGMV